MLKPYTHVDITTPEGLTITSLFTGCRVDTQGRLWMWSCEVPASESSWARMEAEDWASAVVSDSNTAEIYVQHVNPFLKGASC